MPYLCVQIYFWRGSFSLGKVISWIKPVDKVGAQEILSHRAYSELIACKNIKTSTFNLPVMYKDDSMAIVKNLAKVLVYDTNYIDK